MNAYFSYGRFSSINANVPLRLQARCANTSYQYVARLAHMILLGGKHQVKITLEGGTDAVCRRQGGQQNKDGLETEQDPMRIKESALPDTK
mmetsp:Transcript_11397/g.32268  ORF Transcript_11397/g.32268 Transcript_11397/m.32268 type:complete len:91 (+) Transcript_11397:735-1007(+)